MQSGIAHRANLLKCVQVSSLDFTIMKVMLLISFGLWMFASCNSFFQPRVTHTSSAGLSTLILSQEF